MERAVQNIQACPRCHHAITYLGMLMQFDVYLKLYLLCTLGYENMRNSPNWRNGTAGGAYLWADGVGTELEFIDFLSSTNYPLIEKMCIQVYGSDARAGQLCPCTRRVCMTLD